MRESVKELYDNWFYFRCGRCYDWR
jgi:hypothetical protein